MSCEIGKTLVPFTELGNIREDKFLFGYVQFEILTKWRGLAGKWIYVCGDQGWRWRSEGYWDMEGTGSVHMDEVTGKPYKI